jgi:peptidyl-prolyl cis-trans isomerase A (cyclophilin A)
MANCRAIGGADRPEETTVRKKLDSTLPLLLILALAAFGAAPALADHCDEEGSETAAAEPAASVLMDPQQANEQAPEVFRVLFTTTKGEVTIEVNRAWAPLGADRFYNMVKVGYLNDVAFFRAIQGFMVQFGIHGNPSVSEKWRNARINDDPVTQSNLRGMITFATAGPNTRTTQLFINLVDNRNLDGSGFAPFGKVVEGMEVIDSLHMGYGEGAPRGRGPHQGRVQQEGNAYLKKAFPRLDYLISAEIVD